MELKIIANKLEALEENIIFKLITRAQFCHNAPIYENGFFERRLREQEDLDEGFGRYQDIAERPFTKNIGEVNLTANIKKSYLELVPKLCRTGDDAQYGSSVEHDVYALQAIAERVHYGAFYISRSKFEAEMDFYTPLIKTKNEQALMQALTRPEVEKQILERVQNKTKLYQQGSNKNLRNFVNSDLLVNYYQDWIIPLTKQGELAYLLTYA